MPLKTYKKDVKFRQNICRHLCQAYDKIKKSLKTKNKLQTYYLSKLMLLIKQL